MNTIDTFVRLVGEVRGFVFLLWPITMFLVSLLVGSVLYELKKQEEQWSSKTWLILLPISTSLLALIAGVIFEGTSKHQWVPILCFFACPVLIGYAIYMNRKFWMTALSAGLLILWITCFCSLASILYIPEYL